MRRAIEVLNELERDGVIGMYAIGGAVAAIFYMEPFATQDLDVFVALPESGSLLVSLSPLYEALRSRGFREEGEGIEIDGVLVQFLVAYNDLVNEALAEAVPLKVENVPTRVFSPEYLAAIMLQTGRPKDKQRFNDFIEQSPIEKPKFDAILKAHRLTDRLQQWTT